MPPRKSTNGTTPATTNTTRFAKLTVVEVPAPKKKTPAPLPLPQSIKDLAAALLKSATPLAVSVAGWAEEDLTLFTKTIRSNRATLFPEHRVRIAPVTSTDGKPALRLSLGAIGAKK